MAENSSPQSSELSSQPPSDGHPARSSSSGPQPTGIKASLKRLAETKLYSKYKPRARKVKIASQMLIGLILGVLLLAKAIISIPNLLGYPFLAPFAGLNPLDMVAYALFFSSGIELAYMLFTPGPDETLDPLIIGLAAAILLGVSRMDFSKVQEGVTLLLAVSALAGLLVIKKYLYKAEEDEEE